jgi:hypothetical protein
MVRIQAQGPQEVFSRKAPSTRMGPIRFENIEMPDSRIFITEVEVDGITGAV